MADYLVGEILSGLAVDEQEFLRVISISDPVPTGWPPRCPRGRTPAAFSTGSSAEPHW